VEYSFGPTTMPGGTKRRDRPRGAAKRAEGGFLKARGRTKRNMGSYANKKISTTPGKTIEEGQFGPRKTTHRREKKKTKKKP